MFRNKRKYLYFLGLFILVFYILPNVLNFRERKFFSETNRLEIARQHTANAKGFVKIIPGEFYKRGDMYKWFLGEKYRELWTTAETFKVFSYDTVKGGLSPFETGGSQQTISIRLRDTTGRNWVLRSVNKDQQNVLPWWLQKSIVRPVFRDQVAAMNPYGARVVASLAGSIGLPHLNPELYWMPYVEKHGQYNERIAGRLVYLEEYPDSTWQNDSSFSAPLKFLGTDDLEQIKKDQKITIDTLLYLKTRLFDMLINDWDRHQDQWKWALVNRNGKQVYLPIARDRDIAFYIFDEGIISRLAIGANNKFQSFRKEFDDVSGLMKQSKRMDREILKGIPQQTFITLAKEIQSQLQGQSITNAFSEYPSSAHQKFGKLHEEVLRSRLTQLPSVAAKFHQLINDD
jgi:hypothetical protein